MPTLEYFEDFVTSLNGYTEQGSSSTVNFSFNAGSGNGWAAVTGGTKKVTEIERLHKSSTFSQAYYLHFPGLPQTAIINAIQMQVDTTVTSYANSSGVILGAEFSDAGGNPLYAVSRTFTSTGSWQTSTNTYTGLSIPASTVCRFYLFATVIGGNNTPTVVGGLDKVRVIFTYTSSSKNKAYIIG